MTYYYIERMGIYGQGVFWIGTVLEEGKKELKRLALADRDSYHEWHLREYTLPHSTGEAGYFNSPRDYPPILITDKRQEEQCHSTL
jgi:hypothetical protein